MSLYRPTYTDKKTGEKRQSQVWWWGFTFNGKRIQTSSKTANRELAAERMTAAREALVRGCPSAPFEEGVAVGRQSIIAQITEMVSAGSSLADICKVFGISVPEDFF